MFVDHPEWSYSGPEMNEDRRHKLGFSNIYLTDVAQKTEAWAQQADPKEVLSTQPLNEGAALLYARAIAYEGAGEHGLAVLAAQDLLWYFTTGVIPREAWPYGEKRFASPAAQLAQERPQLVREAIGGLQSTTITAKPLPRPAPTPQSPAQGTPGRNNPKAEFRPANPRTQGQNWMGQAGFAVTGFVTQLLTSAGIMLSFGVVSSVFGHAGAAYLHSRAIQATYTHLVSILPTMHLDPHAVAVGIVGIPLGVAMSAIVRRDLQKQDESLLRSIKATAMAA
jgi:hypothetical protein